MIAQKYVENPLTYKSHKLDLRLWVLVTDFNPLTVWLYDDFWMRLAVDEYDDSEGGDDSRKHLTNVS